MEITLEKIELVKDRTGVTYKEAKEALEDADGSVVDAIIAIEQHIDRSSSSRFTKKKDELLKKMKEIVKKGNVSRILVTRNGDTILNIPLSAGVVGTVLAPWGVIAGAIAAFGFKCKIEFIKDDGSVINITEKAEDIYEDAKESYTDFYENIKEKAPDVYEDLKEKGEEAIAKAKYAAKDVKERLKKEINVRRESGQGNSGSCQNPASPAAGAEECKDENKAAENPAAETVTGATAGEKPEEAPADAGETKQV